ncbi:DUF6506 family protein [Photobacterium sanguinicancri]|uniref:DUF6506 family protein n=1 Tax=Photobacterium sanguinicancri TaxID=875932 RepID=A0AAW7YC36_9GAMM|nr:DUF6506 family protein [Photobacterium sanguinicancri]MDO6544577.1 DUF6506 family protein [Photobacterium sanguinicancri]OZS41577.1 hypothetical protein ASV53_22975 [Photobacterium sanguinicancri]
MSAIFKAAFIFVAPAANPSQDYSWVRTNEVHVKTIAVSNYQQACKLMDSLSEEGIKAVELCGGFGHQGVADVVKAANGRMHVGVVRFDKHPCLDFASGDALF